MQAILIEHMALIKLQYNKHYLLQCNTFYSKSLNQGFYTLNKRKIALPDWFSMYLSKSLHIAFHTSSIMGAIVRKLQTIQFLYIILFSILVYSLALVPAIVRKLQTIQF